MMNIRTHNHMSKKQLPKRFIMMSVGVMFATLLSGCGADKLARTSTQYYHAPAQAYNLFLGNAAITGQPTLQESCSEYGSSLQIIDASGDFFRVDVLNLQAYPNLITANKQQSANAIADYFGELYQAPSSQVTPYAVTVDGKKQLYIPMPLTASSLSDSGEVVGMLVSKHQDLLFSLQHVQKEYDQVQMLKKLKALQGAMSVPGKLIQAKPKKLQDDNGKDTPETLGFISIDPNAATPEQISTWKQQARC